MKTVFSKIRSNETTATALSLCLRLTQVHPEAGPSIRGNRQVLSVVKLQKARTHPFAARGCEITALTFEKHREIK